MKYRLVELLCCPLCRADLVVSCDDQMRRQASGGPVFGCQRYCALERTAHVPSQARCAECAGLEIVSGTLSCVACRSQFPIVGSVPWLLSQVQTPVSREVSDTIALYSHLWTRVEADAPQLSTHVEAVENTLGEPVVRGRLGLDAGSGRGADTLAMAKRHPSVELVSVDISEGIYVTRHITDGLPNVHVIRGSVLELPLRSETYDFVYSFGVLHHTPNPLRGMQELARVLKRGRQVSIYLYEDHSDNPWKAVPLKAVTMLRALTARLHPFVLSSLCYLLSPIVVLVFSVPAQIMRRFERTRRLADQLPFNFGTSPFSVHADLLDRLGAPIEERYNRAQLLSMLERCQLKAEHLVQMQASAGWVVRGTKACATSEAQPG